MPVRRIWVATSCCPNCLTPTRPCFYAVLSSSPDKYLPLIYTPTVGTACEEFGHILRRQRGMFLPITLKGRLEEVLGNWPQRDVRFIVVTDGSRILGLGDLGANGMGIPIGKLACYTAAAGIPPEKTLPITLDVGTDRDDLRDAPMYIGLRRNRPEANEYYAFIDEFVQAVQKNFPDCCIQFEDFNIKYAEPLLQKYRDSVCCFNDDIQGHGRCGRRRLVRGLSSQGRDHDCPARALSRRGGLRAAALAT